MDMIYICDHCGKVFGDENAVVKHDKSVGYSWIECPHCGSEDYSDAQVCSECGCIERQDDMFHDGNYDKYICEDCASKMMKDKDLVKSYIATMLPEFVERLTWNYSKEYIAGILLGIDEFKAISNDFIADDVQDFVEFITDNK